MERLAKRRQEASLDSEPTLRDFIQGFSQILLEPAELRAIRAADSLQIELLDKKTLFLAFIYLNNTSGVFRAKDVMRASFDQTVSARDRVRTNKRYEELWEEFEFVRGFNFEGGEGFKRLEEKKPQTVLVLALKHQGLTNSRISKMIGKKETYIDDITKALIFLDIIPPNKSGAKEAKKRNSLMRDIIMLREKGIGNQAIAQRLYIPLEEVRQTAKFFIRTGLTKSLNKREVIESQLDYHFYIKVREGVLKLRLDPDKKYTEQEIAEILTQELGQRVTKQQVKRQIRALLKDEKIERRVNQVK